MSDPKPHIALGLTDHEFDLICEKMGREPNGVELAMFSLLWSEHCAYKHSKKLLGKLPTVAEYMEYAKKIDSMSSDIYRYLNFDKLTEYTEQAGKINVAQLA